MDRHKRVVIELSSQVKNYFKDKIPFRISHGSTNSTRPGHNKRVIDISVLNNVIKIDTEHKVAVVEPNVPMDKLVEATLPHGLIPPVVMEFPGITVGGGYAGTAGESSSFKYGFFDRSISGVEMILGDGEVVMASEKVNEDLFRGAAGAVGTLGVTTLIDLQLIEAKKYVKVTYHPTSNVFEAVDTIRTYTEGDKGRTYDYVDGLLFSRHHGVIITGEMVDELPPQTDIKTFSNPRDPWFYLHVKATTKGTTEPIVEYVPLAEYIFRYDRGGFWVGRAAFRYMRFPFNRFTRWLLDDFLHTRMLYRALHASGIATRLTIQDVAVPYATAGKLIALNCRKLNIWPVWICPLKQSPKPTMHPHTQGEFADTQMLNIGLWGNSGQNHRHSLEKFVRHNELIESKLRSWGGMKWLYAHVYGSKEEFWSQFDRKWHERLRTKYKAQTFPDVYDKVHVDIDSYVRKMRTDRAMRLKNVWPLGGLWGIWKSILSRDYKLHRKATWRTRR